MHIHSAPFRSLALVLVVVLTLTLAAPARAEADVLTILAIASLAVAGVILIAYLIIANVRESRQAEAARIVWVACATCAVAPGSVLPAAAPPQAW